MKRERDLTRRLHSLETLGEAVSAMKGLSAHHFRASRGALDPARSYRRGIEHLVRSTGAFLPAGDGPGGLLIIGAELGLCGSYNTDIAASAAERRQLLGQGPTFCVGRRTAALIGRRGVPLDRIYSAPTSVEGITDVLLPVAQDMLGEYVAGALSCLEVVSSRFEGVGAHAPAVTRLLPVDIRPTERAPAVRYVDPGHLAAVAVRELLYVTMHDLLLDALAAEHGARLAATQSAEQWLDERSERLRRQLSAARREASTQEVIEIASGARVRQR